MEFSCGRAILYNLSGFFTNISQKKLFTIPNGYDSDLIKNASQRLNSTFHIVYSGLLTNNHSFKPFFLMLNDLKSLYPKLKFNDGIFNPKFGVLAEALE